jgi:hypothetical protein
MTTIKALGLLVLCIASGATAVRADTFVIQAEQSGHEAVVRIPVGAVTKLSANSAESLIGYADAQFESMRLSGDVLISIAGTTQTIQIKADSIVLELTPDLVLDTPKSSRAEAASNKLLRSTTMLRGVNDSQVFVGNVVFDLQTPSGLMQIKADRVEHRFDTDTVRAPGGA